MRRERRDLAAEHEPAQALVRAVPGVGEDRHVAGVDGGAGLREELRCGALGAEHVRLEARVEVADQLREARGRAAELGPVVDVQDRDPLASGQDPPVDRLDPARVLAGVEVPLGVLPRGPAERAASAFVAQELGNCVGERLGAEVLDEDAGLSRHDDSAAGP